MSDRPVSPLGTFDSVQRALDATEMLAAPTADALKNWTASDSAEAALFVDTDPEKADTAVFCETYGVPLEASANCVIVAAKRGGETTLAACVALAHTRIDVNRAVRKHLGARKASFAPTETAVEETGMEYGGVTPLGLPPEWPLLIDEEAARAPYVLVGSGRRRGKLILPGGALVRLPGAEAVPGLAG